MQVKLGTGSSAVDITAGIQESTYKIDSVERSTTWRDTGFKEHKYAMYRKIEGSFEMVCIPNLTMAYSAFLSALNSATSDGVTTLSCTVNNLDEQLVEIEAFVEVKFNPIRKISDTLKYKRFTVTVKEC